VLGSRSFVEVFAMSIRVAVDSVVWFSLADRAGAVERSIRISERSFSGWVVEPVFGSYESASDFARRASGVAGVGVVVRRCPAVVCGSVTSSPGLARCLVRFLVRSYRLVQLHGVVVR
jgi:hypothetical protein